ncbi:actin cytoskeletal 2a [Anaeramoeba ignava]|uniref:Actin cytoskeletal 2a n=1 Tax=Anaeramoeba ignava TaxID=1746090 RepID=A0A9Q0L976_ANAIG|nr:actin cytoskeletal 2a [Anaeramoeba ignava]
MEKKRIILLNMGSYNIKAGFGNEKYPCVVFPNYVGRYKYSLVTTGIELNRVYIGKEEQEKRKLLRLNHPLTTGIERREVYIGDEANSKRGYLNLNSPIQNGIIENWDDYERLIHHTFYNELRASPEDHPVAVNEFAGNPKEQSQRIAEIFFETLDVPFLNLNDFCQSVLATVDINSTGVVVHIGDGVCIVEPFINGNPLYENMRRQNIGGYELNLFMRKLLYSEAANLPLFNDTSEIEIIRNIKEKLCYVALDYEQKDDSSKSYELPDGQVVSLSKSRFVCPELLFQPKFQDLECQSIQELIYDSILSCDNEYHASLLQNVILSGGSTMFQGFPTRLKKELEFLSGKEVNIVSLENRKYLSWIGSSKISSKLKDFHSIDEYNENGEIPTFQDNPKISETKNESHFHFQKDLPSHFSMESGNVIVIDQGSSSIKAGFSGEISPKIKISNLIGKNIKNDIYIGDEATSKKELRIEYTMEKGRIQNWDNFEKVYEHLFLSELKIEPTEKSVLITEPIFGSKLQREKIAQILFETFQVGSIGFEIQPLLAFLAVKKKTGIVVDIGDGLIQILPVYQEKFTTNYQLPFFEFGGRDLTQYLIKGLKKSGYYFTSTSDFEFVKQIKENACYVALDYDEEVEMVSNQPNQYEKRFQIKETEVILSAERFQCPEILFQPNLVNLEQPSIQNAIFSSVELFHPKIRNSLLSNIILSGGTTMFDGFQERLKKEISYLSGNENISFPKKMENDLLSWIGGSIFVNSEEFLRSSLKKKEYEEYGTNQIQKFSHFF